MRTRAWPVLEGGAVEVDDGAGGTRVPRAC